MARSSCASPGQDAHLPPQPSIAASWPGCIMDAPAETSDAGASKGIGTGTDTGSGTPASPSPAMDAKARREARKARILGAGTDRLARITKTGRGHEADLLYSDTPKPMGVHEQTAAAAAAAGDIDDDEVLQRADAALQGPGPGPGPAGESDDPQDIDISQAGQQGTASDPFLAAQRQRQQQQQLGRDAASFPNGSQQELPQDLQGMMKALQDMMGGRGGAGSPGMGFPGAEQAGGAAGGQQPPMFPFQAQRQAAGAAAPAASTTTAMDIAFSLLRLLVFAGFGFALVYGAVKTGHAEAQHSMPEKAAASTVDQFAHMSTLHRWARLAYERPAHWEARYFGIESFGLPLPVQGVPIFWLFITLEIGLASMRIMLHRSRPPPPSILLKVAAYIPHAGAQLLLRTLASYLPLLDAFLNDVAVVIFCIGCAVMYAAWKVGLDPLLAPTDGASVAGAAAGAVAGGDAPVLPGFGNGFGGPPPPPM